MTTGPLARTPLHAWHVAHGARLVERGGWQVPAVYTSPEAELAAAHGGAAVADVSAFAKGSLRGRAVLAFVEASLPNTAATRPRGPAKVHCVARASPGPTTTRSSRYRLRDAIGRLLRVRVESARAAEAGSAPVTPPDVQRECAGEGNPQKIGHQERARRPAHLQEGGECGRDHEPEDDEVDQGEVDPVPGEEEP